MIIRCVLSMLLVSAMSACGDDAAATQGSVPQLVPNGTYRLVQTVVSEQCEDEVGTHPAFIPWAINSVTVPVRSRPSGRMEFDWVVVGGVEPGTLNYGRRTTSSFDDDGFSVGPEDPREISTCGAAYVLGVQRFSLEEDAFEFDLETAVGEDCTASYTVRRCTVVLHNRYELLDACESPVACDIDVLENARCSPCAS